MPYTAGRGFTEQGFYIDESGNVQRQNIHGTYGFREFYQGRPELTGTLPTNYDWRTLNRPDIQEGSRQFRMPKPGNLPSPIRAKERIKAAAFSDLTGPEYQKWNKNVGRQMNWRGQVSGTGPEGEDVKVPGSSLASGFDRSNVRQRRTAGQASRQTRISAVAQATTPQVTGMATGSSAPPQFEDPFASPPVGAPVGAKAKGTQFDDVPRASFGNLAAEEGSYSPYGRSFT